jgi:membrane protein DedA with SNARE-associated domain
MNETLSFLVRHGQSVLFACILAEQAGLPFPGTPFLLAAGALARSGHLSLVVAVAVAVLASLLGHLAWYEAGRRKGDAILNLVCRISLEPDLCVRRTRDLYARYGARSLVIAQFIPGLDIVAQPLAGISGVPLARFVAFNLLGAGLWASVFMALGYVFGGQLEDVARVALRLGTWLLAIVLGLLAAHIGWKVHQRQRLLHELDLARIGPEELERKLAAGEDVLIVDLRHPLEFEADPRTIPGALRMAPEELDTRHGEIPRGREVVLYCS